LRYGDWRTSWRISCSRSSSSYLLSCANSRDLCGHARQVYWQLVRQLRLQFSDCYTPCVPLLDRFVGEVVAFAPSVKVGASALSCVAAGVPLLACRAPYTAFCKRCLAP
jgi:hypothetical protein